MVGSAPLRMGGVRTLPFLPAPGAQGGSYLDVAPLVLVGVPAVRDDAALDEAAEVPRQHRRQLRGERVTKGRGREGAGRQPLGVAGEGLQPSYRVRRDVLQARVLPLHRRQEVRLEQTGGGVIPIPGTPPGGGTCPPSPEAPEWPVVHPRWGEGADRRGCGTRMDQRSSDGAPHPPQGLQAGKSQPQSPVSPSKGHQLALGSHSSAGRQ